MITVNLKFKTPFAGVATVKSLTSSIVQGFFAPKYIESEYAWEKVGNTFKLKFVSGKNTEKFFNGIYKTLSTYYSIKEDGSEMIDNNNEKYRVDFDFKDDFNGIAKVVKSTNENGAASFETVAEYSWKRTETKVICEQISASLYPSADFNYKVIKGVTNSDKLTEIISERLSTYYSVRDDKFFWIKD